MLAPSVSRYAYVPDMFDTTRGMVPANRNSRLWRWWCRATDADRLNPGAVIPDPRSYFHHRPFVQLTSATIGEVR